MTKYVSLEHAIRNAVRDQQYKKPLNEDKEWEKDSAAVKASKDPKFINKMIDKWGQRGGAWLNHPHLHPKPEKKKVNEDFEFEMARNELRTAIDAAKRLMAQLDGEGELEAWVQSKITKGADYLDTVADYMDSRDTKKLKEETQELVETMSIINSKFKGNNYTTPVHIAPGVTQAAVKTAGHRRVQKQSDSATMQGKAVNEAKKEEKEDSDNWATRYAKGLWQAGKDVVSGAPETVSSTQGAEAAVKGAVSGFTGRDEPIDPSEIGDISRVGVEASRKLGGKYGPAAKKDKDTEVKASLDAYTPMYDKEKENVEKLQQEKPDAYKAGKAIGQYGPDVASIYSLAKWGGSKLLNKFSGKPATPPAAVEPPAATPKAAPEPTIKAVEPPSAPKAPEASTPAPAPTPASKANDLVPPQFKATEAPKPASDNIPGGTNPPAKPAAPKDAPEPIQPGGKKPANQNLEPEVKGTGTEGLAPKPQAAEPPRPQKPYDTGVKTTKEAPPTPANVNTPDVVPQGTPSPGGATPLPGVKITNRPVGPKPANVPEPATAPAPAKMPVKAPEPATAPAPKPANVPSPAAAPKPVPRIRPQPRVRPGAGPKPLPPRRPFPIPLPSSGDTSGYKAPGAHSEYHDVPVKTSVSQARAHRKFGPATSVSRFKNFKEETGPDNTRRKDSSKELVGRPDSAGVKDPKSVLARNGSIKTKIIDEEKKLAGVVKSVVKKKKEEKESGPNPLVDFEPKLNHKYDNET